VLINLNAREAGNNLSNINRLENMKRRLQKRRQYEVNKRNEARSVENMPQGMYEKRLSNGYIAAYACGPLLRQRYINEMMEVELANFKVEVVKRHENSKITKFKFPRKLNISNDEMKDHLAIGFTDQSPTKDQKLIDQWKTIDNYYQKKILYKSNKSHNPYPPQENNVRKKMQIDQDFKDKDYEIHLVAPIIQNSSTKAKIPDKFKFDTTKLRENNFEEKKEPKTIETSRNNAPNTR
jgi:hypothetical protein